MNLFFFLLPTLDRRADVMRLILLTWTRNKRAGGISCGISHMFVASKGVAVPALQLDLKTLKHAYKFWVASNPVNDKIVDFLNSALSHQKPLLVTHHGIFESNTATFVIFFFLP